MNQNKENEEFANDLINGLLNLNQFILKKKPHIRKYIKTRRLFEEVVNSMLNYMIKGKYDSHKYFEEMTEFINKKDKNLTLDLDMNNNNDLTIINELFTFKNSSSIPSITEEYIKNKKFKNKEKIKMLYAMKNSFSGLFEIKETDFSNGYVLVEDIFTHKKFKITDISLSTPLNQNNYYLYNRIITYDNISFQTGISCSISKENKELKEFIKKHKYKSYPNFYRCLKLYGIFKKEKHKVELKNIT